VALAAKDLLERLQVWRFVVNKQNGGHISPEHGKRGAAYGTQAT
jgi:hypothetical protein